jgi:hypothetical protein
MGLWRTWWAVQNGAFLAYKLVGKLAWGSQLSGFATAELPHHHALKPGSGSSPPRGELTLAGDGKNPSPTTEAAALVAVASR